MVWGWVREEQTILISRNIIVLSCRTVWDVDASLGKSGMRELGLNIKEERKRQFMESGLAAA